MVKKSIKHQMILAFVSVVVLVLMLFFLLNKGFMERYFIYNKEKELETVYQILNETVNKNKVILSDNLVGHLEKSNIALLVSDETGKAIARGNSNTGTDLLGKQLIANIFGRDQEGKVVLKETGSYQISKSVDPRNSSEYVEMWGYLDNGYLYILRTPLESIRATVSLTGRFLVLVGGLIIPVCILFAWYLSRRITEPLQELAGISRKMAGLDFEARYTRDGEDEIALLGQNFNAMSQVLEKTVSELKNANYELQKDIEQKEKIETMRTEFLGNVSHELKTPLALIQGYAEGLKEGISDDPESREFYCDVIMDEASKMNKMVKNLLTLNQLEFGNNEVLFERFDIAELVEGVLESMKILIEQKEAKLNFIKNGPVYVWADEFQVEQVVRNYISNALNHVDGDRVIEVKIQKEDKARISVFNTGKPIPEEDIGQIWDKFYKVDKARTREYGGNGIGLSIVKAVMDSLKQEYGVKNYDNGVEFWFTLDVK